MEFCHTCSVEFCDMKFCDVEFCGMGLYDVEFCNVDICCDLGLLNMNLGDIAFCVVDTAVCNMFLYDVELWDMHHRELVCVRRASPRDRRGFKI